MPQRKPILFKLARLNDTLPKEYTGTLTGLIRLALRRGELDDRLALDALYELEGLKTKLPNETETLSAMMHLIVNN
jgi:hypothetical protein